MSATTVYRARKIITMDMNCPSATHVAVRDGKIIGVGDEQCAAQWGAFMLDTSLSDMVLMPGFVEGHAHMMAGAMWKYAYAGYHDRFDPNGKLWKGMTNIDSVVESLSSVEQLLEDDQPLIGWGFDPIFLRSERLSRHHLDAISSTRPIAIIYSNFHLMCVNSAALRLAGYDAESTAEGIIKGADGLPTGELQEMAAMFPVMRRMGIDFRTLTQSESSIRAYAEVAKRAGVTTITDLFSTMEDSDLELMLRVTTERSFALRIVPALGVVGADAQSIAERALSLRQKSTDKLRMGAVKLMTDGSIQGWTARVKWPGYVGGQANGIWNTPPAQIEQLCEVMHREGVQMHIHVNGDEAAEVSIDAIESAMRKSSWQGHRHVLQHCQMMSRDQYLRCTELGICTNIFSNHIWYFGDQHAELTVGEVRAQRMNACRTALDSGVKIAMHSDAPVTPLAPLFTAWCAVNRRTMSNRVLGEQQCISVDEALHAITLGAAYTLKLDKEIGSIETGKIADFALLADDPTAIDPMKLKDIEVLGTVSSGVVHRL